MTVLRKLCVVKFQQWDNFVTGDYINYLAGFKWCETILLFVIANFTNIRLKVEVMKNINGSSGWPMRKLTVRGNW